jgi:hypothetical protein
MSLAQASDRAKDWASIKMHCSLRGREVAGGKSAFAFEFWNFIALLLRVSLSRLLFVSPSSFFMLFLPFFCCLFLAF